MTATMMTRFGRTAAAALGAGALLVTVGCGQDRGAAAQALTTAASPAAQPVVVSCEPHQRALVRPVTIDGAAVSQVECVSAAANNAAAVQQAAPAVAAPAASVQQPVYRQASTAQPVDALDDARVVPVSTPRPVQTREVVYEREPVKAKRSVKKSAVIIGSSAGVGAGVGAAIGGKKGALIGAAIGGGGAAVWDQVTRR
jgi:hypothetical protein